MRVSRATCIGAVLVLTAGCTTGEGRTTVASLPPSSAEIETVVIDTDLAVDDLFALAFLLSSPGVEVAAITVSGTGEVRCPRGLEVVAGLLAHLAAEDIPVACGRTEPLEGNNAFPTEWRDAADAAWGLELPAAPAISGGTAVELLSETLGGGSATLLTLGPLTNVAETFRTHPGLTAEVSSIVVMGGAVDVPGNVFQAGPSPPAAEWNAYVDPVATAEVLASGAPITLMALDATNSAPITEEFVDLLRRNARTDAANLALALLENNTLVEAGAAYFWDPLAAAVVVDPSLVTTETVSITVVSGGEETGRTARDSEGFSVELAVDADNEALEQLLIATLAHS